MAVVTRFVLAAAGALGGLLRRVREGGRTLAELAGVAFAAYGLYTAWRPLAFLAIGAALLIASWRAK